MTCFDFSVVYEEDLQGAVTDRLAQTDEGDRILATAEYDDTSSRFSVPY
jgi:hypothetical protein